jgi:hypothetical protein
MYDGSGKVEKGYRVIRAIKALKVRRVVGVEKRSWKLQAFLFPVL